MKTVITAAGLAVAICLINTSSLAAAANNTTKTTNNITNTTNVPATPKTSDPWPARTTYLEANIGGNLNYSSDLFDNKYSYDTSGAGWSGAIGYNFFREFALEAGVMQNYNLSSPSEEDDNVSIHVHNTSPYLATRFTIPIKNFAIIGKFGVTYAIIDGSTRKDGKTYHLKDPPFLLVFSAIGAGYSITPHIQLVAQYQTAIFPVLAGGIGLASLGIDYRF